MTIAAILDRKGHEVVTIDGAARLRDAVSILTRNHIGAMPVMREGRVSGVLSERDIIHCLNSEGADALDRPVENAMTSPAITVDRDMPVLAALSLMSERRIRHLPVVEDDRLVGMVSIGDLVKFRIDRIEEEASAMRSYIQSA